MAKSKQGSHKATQKKRLRKEKEKRKDGGKEEEEEWKGEKIQKEGRETRGEGKGESTGYDAGLVNNMDCVETNKYEVKKSIQKKR